MFIIIRLLTTLLIIGLASALGLWLSDHPGDVQLDWMGYRIATKFWVVLVLLAVVAVMGVVLLSFIMRGVHFLSFFVTRRSLKQHRSGLEALTHTVAALSLSDYTGAQHHLNQSRKLLGNDLPLNTLLQAHIASRTGHQKAALKALESMQEWPETRFVALNRLSALSKEAGDTAEALRYAKEAYQLRPKDMAGAVHYLGLLVKSNAWVEAHALVKALRWQRIISKDQALHYTSHVSVAEAMSDVSVKQDKHLLEEAYRADPSFPPAYAYLVELVQQGTWKRALKELARSWKLRPHPALIDIMLSHLSDASDAMQMKRAALLVSYHPKHIESHIGLSRIALNTNQWDVARNHLKAALTLVPQARVFRLLATLEEVGYKDNAAASLWLKRLAEAEPDPAWHCHACGYRSSQWASHCETCDSFDSYEWGQGLSIYPHIQEKVDPLSINAS